MPFIDDFVPAGTLASLERLGVLLSDAPTRREAARRARGFGGEGRPLGGARAADRVGPARGRRRRRRSGVAADADAAARRPPVDGSDRRTSIERAGVP